MDYPAGCAASFFVPGCVALSGICSQMGGKACLGVFAAECLLHDYRPDSCAAEYGMGEADRKRKRGSAALCAAVRADALFAAVLG